jgi:hypothetical protein
MERTRNCISPYARLVAGDGSSAALPSVRRCSQMKGFIYIASAFHTVNRSKCGRGGSWIDNDPHFWTSPPTWSICRNDLRKRADPGDYIFFVLPRHCRHPQMIFGYLRIAEPKITHAAAYHRPDLKSKRMGNKNPNGNILVDARGNYSRFDDNVHKAKFSRIKGEYAIGDPANSRLLDDHAIRSLAPDFVVTLSTILGIPQPTGQRPYDIITQKGREINAQQVSRLLAWLSKAPNKSSQVSRASSSVKLNPRFDVDSTGAAI